MATIFTRQKDGTMKTSYTGMDALVNNVEGAAKTVGRTVGKVAKTVASLPGKYIDAVANANDAVYKAKVNKQTKDIQRAFGTVDNYNRMGGLMP